MGTSSGYSSAARRQAAHILSQPPFTSSPGRAPAPLRGVLHAIGQGLRDVFGPPLSWILRHVILASYRGLHSVFGAWAWVVLAAIALAIGTFAGVLLARGRARIAAEKPTDLVTPDTEDVEALDAAAAAADAKGQYAEAVRLRFRAGLARLEGAGVIASRLVATTQQVHRALRSQMFDRLAAVHEAVAYAGAPATSDDSESARQGWPLVLAEATSARTLDSARTRGSAGTQDSARTRDSARTQGPSSGTGER